MTTPAPAGSRPLTARLRARYALLRVARRIFPPAPVVPLGYSPDEPLPADVVVYFPDTGARVYQLAQWLRVLERLDEHHRVLIVTRRMGGFNAITAATSLRTVYVPRFRELMALYDGNDYKLALYVNNSAGNFQSLSSPRMLHVHIGHGESDKISMVSNQAKAYDSVFVAGPAAVLRHRAALLDFDESRLVPVGRPQLDLVSAPLLPISTRRTILYAPTWEGENEANNYTSVDCYGPAVVRAALALPDVRVVYKPHPRVTSSVTPAVIAGHTAVVRAIQDAARADPGAGHAVLEDGDILAVLPECDLIVADVSSVALDFLYLRTERPLVLTDRRSDRAELTADAPISEGAYVLDAENVPDVRALLEECLVADPRRGERERLRRFYFGDLAPGESTEGFLAEVTRRVQLRDGLVREKYDRNGSGGQGAHRWETTGRTVG